MAIPLDTFISVTITAGTRAITRIGFGVPCLIAYFPTTIFANRTRVYSPRTVLTDLVADGFSVNHPVYKMAQALTSQANRPPSMVVGRRANPPVQAIDLEMENTTETITVTLRYDGNTETYTRVGTGAPAADATALAASITAGIFGVATLITAAGVGNDVQIRQGAGPDTGQLFTCDDLAYCKYDDVTADPGLAADITAIRAENDDWYWALLDSASQAENEALATSIEALEKVAAIGNQDSDCFDGVAANILKNLAAASRTRCFVNMDRFGLDEYPACTLVGEYASRTVGSWVMSWAAPSGWTADAQITSAEYTNIETDNGNVNVQTRNVGNVQPGGRTPAGSWIDLIQLTDWLREEIRVRLATALSRAAQTGKIPYDDNAGTLAGTEILAAYEQGAKNGGFELTDFSYEFTAAALQTASDRNNRLFNGCEFGGTFKGAVREFTVTGRIEE
jgi:hypothetical protein